MSIRAIAVGFEGGICSFGNAFSFLIFSDVSQAGLNPFLLSGILFFMLMLTFIWLPETLGYEVGDQIVEVLEEKEKEERGIADEEHSG